MEIISFGVGGRMEECVSRLREACPSVCRVQRLIVLPIPTTKDGKLVTGTHITLEDALCGVERGTLVAGYGIPEEICCEVVRRGGVLYDASLDEEFLEENAELTAVGAVARLICAERRSPRDMHIGVVGFGRIGKRLVRYLLFFGARVRIYSGNREVLGSLQSLGVEGCEYGELSNIGELDLVINTAPKRLIRESDVTEESGVRIIDLASGNVLLGVPRVEKMPSVPSEMFPVSAGRAYAERILSKV